MNSTLSTRNASKTLANPKSKPRERSHATSDLPKIGDRLQKKNGTSVKMKEQRTVRHLQSAPKGNKEDRKPMECKWSTCQEVFITNQELIEHVRRAHVSPLSELEPRPQMYNCDWRECNGVISFDAHYKLVMHVRQHTEERPFECSKCSSTFRRCQGLKEHERVHTGEKSYKCKEANCEKMFSNPNERAKHIKRVHLNEKRVCGYQECKQYYTDRSSLRKHIKKAHSGEVWDEIKKLNATRRRGPKKNKKESGSKDRANNDDPDSEGHSLGNPYPAETIETFDPNDVFNREGESNATNGNEIPEVAEFQVIEPLRPEESYSYNNAPFVQFPIEYRNAPTTTSYYGENFSHSGPPTRLPPAYLSSQEVPIRINLVQRQQGQDRPPPRQYLSTGSRSYLFLPVLRRVYLG